MNKCKKNQNGFTLIEVSIILIVIGFLVVPIIQQYRNYIYNQSIIITEQINQTAVIDSISKFFEENGFYPCPELDLTLAITDAAFGTPNCADAAALPAGQTVVYGHIPVQVLQIDTRYALDAWGNKMTYAVTRNMIENPADPGSFNVRNGDTTFGAIVERYIKSQVTNNRPSFDIADFTNDIVDPNPAFNILPSETAGHAAIISHGPTGFGAYNAQGNLVAACPAAGSAHDRENCDNDDALIFSNSLKLDKSNEFGADFYDDIVTVFNGSRSPEWSFLQSSQQDTYSNYRIIGINTDDPMGETSAGEGVLLAGNGELRIGMDVGGDILAENTADSNRNGQILADEICDETGDSNSSGNNNCFNPNIIAGAGINCGSNTTAITGIANNNATCLRFVPTNPNSYCPAGEYIVGLDASGDLICDRP